MLKENILIILPRYSERINDSSLEKDLVNEFKDKGHKVTVVTLRERKEKKVTTLKIENGIQVLRVKTGNFRDDVNKYEKGITKILNPYIFYNQIKKKLSNEKYDLIITTTPISNSKYLHKKLKKEFKLARIITIIWDMFPQNALDLEMLKKNYLYKVLKKGFHNSLLTADFITAMSKGNLEYLKAEYINIEKKIFVLKNWSKIKEKPKIEFKKIREKYGFNSLDFIVVFGGNMGKPQKLENILELADSAKEKVEIKFLFVGNGTEKEKLKEIKIKEKLNNVKFIDYIPREDYEKLITACDIGLVSLDERFTVPNFPSKTTDYCKLGLPILASLDNCALNDYGIYLEKKIKGGLVGRAGNTEDLKEKLLKLYTDEELRVQLGENSRKYYEKYLGVDKAYETIMNKINGDEFDV